MVNTNIQGPVPLSGRGFIARRHGDYQPGEFKQLNNCYIDEKGSIQNRNNFFCLRDNVNNVEEILGTYENFNVIHSFAAQYINNKFQGPWNLLWSDTNLPAATGTNPGKRLLGFFKYNDGIYWLSVKMNTNASSKITTWKFYLHYKLNYVPTNPSLPLTEVTFASLTTVEILSVGISILNTGLYRTSKDSIFKSFFIHKERLWIVTAGGVYFSKATDPKIFAVPDGGFFLFPEDTLNCGVGFKDSVIVASNSSYYSITYQTDPNIDSSSQKISDRSGAVSLCVSRDMVYGVNDNFLYTTNGYTVDKVMALDIDVNDFNFDYLYKIIGYKEYIILLRYKETTFYTGAVGNEAKVLEEMQRYFNTGSTATDWSDYNCYFINLDTGSVHTITCPQMGFAINYTFIDMQLNAGWGGEQVLYFLARKNDNTTDLGATFYFEDIKERRVQDTSVDVATVDGIFVYKQDYTIELVSFSPDGTEYSIKKFRNLLLMAHFPWSGFGLQVAFDNTAYGAVIELINFPTDVLVLRPLFPSKVGLNQRARSMSLLFKTVSPTTPISGDDENGPLIISDIRTLWGYTERVIETKRQQTIT